MKGDYGQNSNRNSSTHIRPRKDDVLLILILSFIAVCTLSLIHWDIFYSKQSFGVFAYLVYYLVSTVRMCQRASIDSHKLKYYILGLIPIEIYWYDVSQVGIVHVYRGSSHRLLGEMFVIVLEPCEKYEEGFRELRWWNIRPKWRHPFLVKNIYCETGKYKEIIEEYSRKKVSFEIEYS